MTYDAIIVGSGHNGLACAIHLAKQGWKVGVFERNRVAGGAVQTREVTLPGFRHDLFAMNLGLFAGSAVHARAWRSADAAWARFRGRERLLRHTLRRRLLVRRVAGHGEEHHSRPRFLRNRCGKLAPHERGLRPGRAPDFLAARQPHAVARLLAIGWKAWRAHGLAWIMDTLRLLVSSPRAFLDANFESDKIKATLAAWGMHLDFAPDIAGGALFPYLEAMADQSFGMALGKGGADVMINSMTGYLKELGGELHLEARGRPHRQGE